MFFRSKKLSSPLLQTFQKRRFLLISYAVFFFLAKGIYETGQQLDSLESAGKGQAKTQIQKKIETFSHKTHLNVALISQQ